MEYANICDSSAYTIRKIDLRKIPFDKFDYASFEMVETLIQEEQYYWHQDSLTIKWYRIRFFIKQLFVDKKMLYFLLLIYFL